MFELWLFAFAWLKQRLLENMLALKPSTNFITLHSIRVSSTDASGAPTVYFYGWQHLQHVIRDVMRNYVPCALTDPDDVVPGLKDLATSFVVGCPELHLNSATQLFSATVLSNQP